MSFQWVVYPAQAEEADVVEQLRHSLLSLVLVVGDHGSLEGIVTEGDILKTIVADIEEDEGPRIVQRDDGLLLMTADFRSMSRQSGSACGGAAACLSHDCGLCAGQDATPSEDR